MAVRILVAILAALTGAAGPVWAQQGQGEAASITRAEAEALSPSDLAARFLDGEMDPAEAADATLGAYGPLQTHLGGATVLRAPAPAPEHAGFCRQTGYAITFEPQGGWPGDGRPVRGGRDDPYVFSFARAVAYYAEAPADGGCAQSGGWAALDGGYFPIRGDAAAGLEAVAQARALMRRAAAGAPLERELFCDDLVQPPGRGPCADEPAALAGLAEDPVSAVRYIGPNSNALLYRDNPCDDAALFDRCFQITFGPVPGRRETWRVYSAGSPDARSLRMAAVMIR